MDADGRRSGDPRIGHKKHKKHKWADSPRENPDFTTEVTEGTEG
jgi:hypothetical protein